jgi:hypothetical protein
VFSLLFVFLNVSFLVVARAMLNFVCGFEMQPLLCFIICFIIES